MLLLIKQIRVVGLLPIFPYMVKALKFLFRFSIDPETSMGLVQHEGGPCGVLAAVQVIF